MIYFIYRLLSYLYNLVDNFRYKKIYKNIYFNKIYEHKKLSHYNISIITIYNKKRMNITLNYAQSINGCISKKWAEMYPFSNKKSFKITHQLRANNDLIMVGIGTIIANNPSLTVRYVTGIDPIPVIIDKNCDIPLDIKLIKKGTIIIINLETLYEKKNKINILEKMGIKIIPLKFIYDNINIFYDELFEILNYNYSSIMIEGGSNTLSNLLGNYFNKINNILITISPIFLNGEVDVLCKKFPIDSKLTTIKIYNINNDTLIVYNNKNNYNYLNDLIENI